MAGKMMGRGYFFRVFGVVAMVMGLAAVATARYPNSGDANSGCLTCHNDIWEDSRNKAYVHLPFAEKECEKCHSSQSKRNNNIDRKTKNSDIKWVGRNRTPAKTHWFDFKPEKNRSMLFIEARARNNGLETKELSLPPLGEIESADDENSAPPIISKVKVLEVSKGIFLSATVGWETDKPSNSQVLFGLKKLNQTSSLDGQMTTKHYITLTGIKSNKEYRFKVVSEDMSGSRVESRVFTFSTKKTFSEISQVSPAAVGMSGKIDLATEIYSLGDGYTAKITANRPVAVSLGLKARKYGEWSKKSGAGPKVVKHVVTNSQAVTTISICYTCHTRYKRVLSHPVNVYPKRGMRIPPEYPTLADGRITCMSCHATHASNLEYRLLKPHKKDLCIGCHVDMV